MAENRCLLTERGRSALDRLLEKAYPESKGLNKSQIQRDTRLSRDTLNKIFNEPYQPVQKRCLEDLFERLNSKLKENYRTQNQYRRGEEQAAYERRVNQALKGICIEFRDAAYCTENIEERAPRSPSSNSQLRQFERSPTPGSSRNLPLSASPQEQLDTLLKSLNYTKGQALFEESIRTLKPSGAFLLQVRDTKVQRWLVRRLVHQVPGFQNTRPLEINVALLGGEFEQLWSEFARQLKLTDGTAEATIANLSELCQGKTVIIVLSRLQQLDEEMQRQLIGKFWVPLVQQIGSQQQDWRSRLVLFLIQDGERSEESPKCPFSVVPPDEAMNPEHPVLLEPLTEIYSQDVQAWFEREGTSLLQARIGEKDAEQFMQQIMQQNRLSRWETHPWTTLENICNVFQTEIAEIEQYWKLAG